MSKWAPNFRWIEPCVYEVGTTGYRVEQMQDCSWDAYLPDAWDIRLWQSVRHGTRASATMAVSAERRRIAKAVHTAVTKVDG